MINNLEYKRYYLIFLIIVLIGFQQFPVIRIGGSLKIYEVLAIILLVLNISSYKFKKTVNPKLLCLWILFVVSPIISLIYNYLFLGYPSSFYKQYGAEALSFKFNYWVFPFLQLLYVFFNYTVISTIYRNNLLYKRFDYFIKVFVIIGTFIAIYSLIAFFTIDIIRFLPDFIQNKSEYYFRSSGFSQEPSFYVLYQFWVVLFSIYSKKYFRYSVWLIMVIVNIISLIFTFSTTLLALMVILFISLFVFKVSLKIRIFVICCIFCISVGISIYITKLGYNDILTTIFIHKVENFFETSDHTLDSGSFRNYTSRIGIAIFKDHPALGVGVGNSVYYMQQYDPQMGIITYGEELHAGSFPQNLFSSVLAEQGFIGGFALCVFLIIVIRNLWKNRNRNKLCNIFFIGGLFNIAAMFSIAPIYSLFLWVFLGLALGYFNYLNKNTKDEI